MEERRRKLPPRYLIDPLDHAMVDKLGLSAMDVYRTNTAVDLWVHMDPECIARQLSQTPSEEKNSILRALQALEEESQLDREFTTTLGDAPFGRPVERKSTVRDIYTVVKNHMQKKE